MRNKLRQPSVIIFPFDQPLRTKDAAMLWSGRSDKTGLQAFKYHIYAGKHFVPDGKLGRENWFWPETIQRYMKETPYKGQREVPEPAKVAERIALGMRRTTARLDSEDHGAFKFYCFAIDEHGRLKFLPKEPLTQTP